MALISEFVLYQYASDIHLCKCGNPVNVQRFPQRGECTSLSSQYLNQCWNIVNSNLRNKLQWKLKRKPYIFIQENAFENVVWKMAVLSRPQWVKGNQLTNLSDRNTPFNLEHDMHSLWSYASHDVPCRLTRFIQGSHTHASQQNQEILSNL